MKRKYKKRTKDQILRESQRKLIYRSKTGRDDTSIMENLEDAYGMDLTHSYGESPSNIKKLIARLKKKKNYDIKRLRAIR